jgi:hypothetical protein
MSRVCNKCVSSLSGKACVGKEGYFVYEICSEHINNVYVNP